MSEIMSKIFEMIGVLSSFREDIVHYRKGIVSMRETIRLMWEVDVVTESAGGWPMK